MSQGDSNFLAVRTSSPESAKKYFYLELRRMVNEIVSDKFIVLEEKIKLIEGSIEDIYERLGPVDKLPDICSGRLVNKLVKETLEEDDCSELAGYPFQRDLLEPLDRVIINDSLMDELLVSLSILELINGEDPQHFGVILYGDPGNGKTEILKSFVDVYKRAGAYVTFRKITEIIHSHVGQSAKNLEKIIEDALAGAIVKDKPSLIALDEAGILVSKAKDGTVSKLYQSVLDTLKRYVGNNPNLIVMVSTNKRKEFFEDALVREGRFTSLEVGYPGRDECRKMFQYFLDKYDVFDLSDDQAYELVDSLDGFTIKGSFLEEFGRTYVKMRVLEHYRADGSTVLEALKAGVNISVEDVKESISFDSIKVNLLKKAGLKKSSDHDNGIYS